MKLALLATVVMLSPCNPGPSSPGTPTPDPEPALPPFTIHDTSVDHDYPHGLLVDVRAGTHDGFDRLVFEFDGGIPSYDLSYVDKPTWQCGSGEEVWLAGDAWLEVGFDGTAAHDDDGYSTLDALYLDPGYVTLIEAQSTCDYEGEVTWVAGLASPFGYRAFELTNPSRLVVDFKH